uniref:Uncharacterized protein n=1 Tax=Strigamia maritima TaxID=126957 RepID=T1J435_STRMM
MDQEYEKRLLRQQNGQSLTTPTNSPLNSRKSLTPVNSPNKDKYGDRFIPSRAGAVWQIKFQT